MSYSFSVESKDREKLMALAEAKFVEVVALQPVHAKDRWQALGSARSALNLLRDPPEGSLFSLSMSGFLSWTGEMPNPDLTGASIQCSVSHRRTEVA